MNLKNTQGFTLIEVMVTVIIVAILATVALPYYTGYLIKVRRTDAKIALVGLAQAQQTFYTDWRSYAPYLGTRTTYDTLRCLPSFCTIDVTIGEALSPDGHYVLSIDPNHIATRFILTARAKTNSPQAKDSQCPTLTLDSLNQKTPTGCWK